MCRRVETDYQGAPNKAERLATVARLLSDGVYIRLKKRGLLAGPRGQEAGGDAPEGHGPEGEDSP